MQTFPIINCVEEVAAIATTRTFTLRCYAYPPLTAKALWPNLAPDRELTSQATSLLMQLDAELKEARADWNEDRFRRLMRLRPRAVIRLRRRWERLDPQPRIPLGCLRRRYHASIARYLHDQFL
ncbi:MAG TPA: hypothetical protein VJS64_15225 [Pyrinomonadaceae bacterium]|nr:hypothetical protein [Pyrinomonadaceae bacterium]